MRSLLATVLVACVCACASVPAIAQTYNNGWNFNQAVPHYRVGGSVQRTAYPRRQGKARQAVRQVAQYRAQPRVAVTQASHRSAEILPHPAGCPRTLFCGCGAAVKVFGSPLRHLWLAANWLRFPRAQAAPGMVAANRRHVFVIEQVLGNGMVLAYDANSGRGLTRRHVRSLSGFTVVNPHGGRA